MNKNKTLYGNFQEGGGPTKTNAMSNNFGPISFLNSYYNSPEFKRKSGWNYDANMSFYKRGSDRYIPKVVDSDKEGSHSAGAKEILYSPVYENRGKPTVILDKKQAHDLKYDLFNDVLPHEYSHTTRLLNSGDEALFATKNKNSFVKTMFDRYKTDTDGLQAGKTFSEWAHPIADHTQLPSENYSDLNTLRWNMYKNGIYDARKEPMTIDHLKKAMSDPKMKDNELLKRLLKSFSPEDLVQLNNTIATVESKTPKNENIS